MQPIETSLTWTWTTDVVVVVDGDGDVNLVDPTSTSARQWGGGIERERAGPLAEIRAGYAKRERGGPGGVEGPIGP